ncbi:hypothetical protein HMPREF9565_01436 [Cutibacterium acnes HL053PA2]|nr:hypothetical protein HMPREF9575_00058 [Cutibacterium acnes HL110PA1]EFS44477.1 hypothetical protein HMPREF9576_00406 [Cutibacterium acnes HL110PA2]EFS51682.1 hypothetical protein HMPREF9587_00761 [Cutibacterium acnes HL025PA1]EFT08155.1 hypothetical protein HMPREF9618_01021 [Cutibacterium acnes HL082PA1]EFT50341.1 hypothetical protein HMPREF9565_01436 [Cutibacterium acnes HL053PA2]EGF04246.1 hypothetical protein HMPREF9584_00791 [Cutibacterium acnes HL092PA1]
MLNELHETLMILRIFEIQDDAPLTMVQFSEVYALLALERSQMARVITIRRLDFDHIST